MSGDSNIVKMQFTAPVTKSWYRFCLAPNNEHEINCRGGAMIMLHPKRWFWTMCNADTRVQRIGNFGPGDTLSIKYDPANQEMQLRVGSDVRRTCPTTSTQFYGKVFIWQKLLSVTGVELITATQDAAMVKKFSIGDVPQDVKEMPP